MENDIEMVVKSLKNNDFRVKYAENTEIARGKILEMIPKGATVGIGDSATIRQIGVLEELSSKGRIVINPFSREISKEMTAGNINKRQRRRMHMLALMCDFFLTGTNAFTLDGKLVNVDGGGNRIVGMIYGPKQVILVVGKNKMVKNVDEAFYRVKNVIAPMHARTKKANTPCAITGKCIDCKSKQRICRVSCIIERNPSYSNITVLLVNEDLGLSWDESWPKGRIHKIYTEYAKVTWLMCPPWFGQEKK